MHSNRFDARACTYRFIGGKRPACNVPGCFRCYVIRMYSTANIYKRSIYNRNRESSGGFVQALAPTAQEPN